MAKSWAQVRAAVGELDPGTLPFQVLVLEASALGPIAFIDGDLVVARSILVERGVAHVYRYDHGPEGGGDPAYHISNALSWLLGESADVVRSVVSDAPGYVGMRHVPERGTLQLYWCGAVPTEVAELVGALPNGARLDPVIIVPFGPTHLREAQAAVHAAIRAGIVQTKLSLLGIDSDFSCLFLGVVEPDADRRQEIARELQAIVDVPVRVVFEEQFTACDE